MANFKHPSDFLGTYDGHWDGRRARLTIDDRVGDSGRFLCNITLEDRDRGATYRATHVSPEPKQHIFKDIELRGISGTRGSKKVKILMLQTWNTDFLCGHDVWRNIEFGFSFQRR